jgi:hypothetical protein
VQDHCSKLTENRESKSIFFMASVRVLVFITHKTHLPERKLEFKVQKFQIKQR